MRILANLMRRPWTLLLIIVIGLRLVWDEWRRPTREEEK